jgi:hypothetical protein
VEGNGCGRAFAFGAEKKIPQIVMWSTWLHWANIAVAQYLIVGFSGRIRTSPSVQTCGSRHSNYALVGVCTRLWKGDIHAVSI